MVTGPNQSFVEPYQKFSLFVHRAGQDPEFTTIDFPLSDDYVESCNTPGSSLYGIVSLFSVDTNDNIYALVSCKDKFSSKVALSLSSLKLANNEIF